MKLREIIKEQAQYYNVKHKPSGKVYRRILAMSQASAITRAAMQHGGRSASKYSGTSDDQFEIVEGAEDFYTKLTALIHDEEAYAKACGISMKKLDQEMGEISRDLNLHMDDDRNEIIMRHAQDQEEKIKKKGAANWGNSKK